LFGLCAGDPSIDLKAYIKRIVNNGFSGIVNFPSVGVFDGNFRLVLEETRSSFQKEVEPIKIAHDNKILTLAFVFNEAQAEQMAQAGADIICANMGFTKGGALGSKKVLTLQKTIEMLNKIYNSVNKINNNIFKLV